MSWDEIDDLHTFVINYEPLYLAMVEETGSSGDDIDAEYAWVRRNREWAEAEWKAYNG